MSSIRTDADAILAVWFASVGYYSPPRSTTYQPCVVAKARLIDGRSRGDLYFKTFSAGCEPTVKNGVYVPSAERYRYASFGDLMARTPGSEHGLAEATQAIVSQISADLARR